MERGAPSDRLHRIAQGVLRHITVISFISRGSVLIHEAMDLNVSSGGGFLGFRQCNRGQERTMLGKNVVDEELKRGLGLSIKEIEPFLRALPK
jgi:hypothetical protein